MPAFRVPLAGLLLCLAACAGPPAPAATTTAMRAPATAEARRSAALELGRRLYAAVGSGTVEQIVLDDPTLREVLQPEAAGRASVLRLNLGRGLHLPEISRTLLERAPYRGACLQDVRHERAREITGLRAPGWVVRRVLIVGQDSTGGHVAAWVEGTFVFTDGGFRAVLIERVETPRRDHADLQIATCDLRAGLD